MKQLQEKLNRLVYSMNFQNIETEDFNSQQPLAFSHVLENNLNGSFGDGEETDKLPPVDEFSINEITQDVIDSIANQDSLKRNEMPNVPVEDKVDLQDGSLCLQVSLPSSSRDLTFTEEAEPLKNALSAMDLSSWSSPEVVRKDSMLEPPPSLPLTPCLDVLSQHSLDISLKDRMSASVLQADQSGLLCSLGGSAVEKAPGRAESSLAADRGPSTDPPVHRMVVVSRIPCPASASVWCSGPQGVPMGLCLHGPRCHSGSHCWFTSCRPVGRVWMSSSQSPGQQCVGTVSFLQD